MEKSTINELEIASRSVVMQAARQFAETLKETLQYREFMQSYENFQQDAEAQRAIRDFQTKQSSLRAMRMLNALSEKDRAELKSLEDQVYRQPSVIRYTKAQEELIVICQEIGDILSEGIGIDYASSCKTGGCCG